VASALATAVPAGTAVAPQRRPRHRRHHPPRRPPAV